MKIGELRAIANACVTLINQLKRNNGCKPSETLPAQ